MIDARDSRRGGSTVATSRTGRRVAATAVRDVCPYLVAGPGPGGWRNAFPDRDQRCGAMVPPAPLPIERQRQLCLLPEHQTCAAYLAAIGLLDGRDDPKAGGGSLLWPSVRTTPLVLEPARRRLPAGAFRGPRTGGQLVLAGLMVIALVIIVVTRATPSATGGDDASPAAVAAGASPSVMGPGSSGAASATASATASPTTDATPSPALTPPPASAAPTPAPTPRPTASPVPTGSQRYTVSSGDTLSSIAARFGTTVKAIARLNGITNPRLIRPGQVLLIP
jgi:LysM repeat protein